MSVQELRTSAVSEASKVFTTRLTACLVTSGGFIWLDCCGCRSSFWRASSLSSPALWLFGTLPGTLLSCRILTNILIPNLYAVFCVWTPASDGGLFQFSPRNLKLVNGKSKFAPICGHSPATRLVDLYEELSTNIMFSCSYNGESHPTCWRGQLARSLNA